MILVVTNKAAVADELRTLIGSCGYAVRTHDCTDDLPTLTRFAKPTLMILDCDLPDSFSLVRQTRADPFTQHIPVVMFAVASVSWENKARAAGADAYVSKGDLDWADLLREIRRYAGTPRPEDHAEQS